jgi:heptosyltransferase-2
MSSLVIQTSFLGDMVLTTPLLARLAERGPVDVVATPANAGLLANHPAVRDIIVFDKRGAARGLRGLKRIANQVRWRETTGGRELRNTRVAYLAQGSVRSATLAILGGVGERVGFATSSARLLYTRRVAYRQDLHHAARLWQLASVVANELPDAPLAPSLYPGAQDIAAVNALLEANRVAANEPLIALAPGSVWATKRWPSYEALAENIARNPLLSSHRVVVVGTLADRGLAEAIGERLLHLGAPAVVDATGRLSLLASADLLSRSRALVTNDSAPLHLASAMGTPTVALFGPTVPAFGFGSLAPTHVELGARALPCRPCHAHGPQACPLGHWKCMRELSPDSVTQALAQLQRPSVDTL